MPPSSPPGSQTAAAPQQCPEMRTANTDFCVFFPLSFWCIFTLFAPFPGGWGPLLVYWSGKRGKSCRIWVFFPLPLFFLVTNGGIFSPIKEKHFLFTASAPITALLSVIISPHCVGFTHLLLCSSSLNNCISSPQPGKPHLSALFTTSFAFILAPAPNGWRQSEPLDPAEVEIPSQCENRGISPSMCLYFLKEMSSF